MHLTYCLKMRYSHFHHPLLANEKNTKHSFHQIFQKMLKRTLNVLLEFNFMKKMVNYFDMRTLHEYLILINVCSVKKHFIILFN